MRLFWVSILLLGLAGCSGTPACLEQASYHDVEQFPPLRAPAGMSVPEADPNLRVPEVGQGPIAAFSAQTQDEEGKEEARRRCLSSPPPLPDQGEAES